MDYVCDTCADKWNGAYNGDGRCVTCGNPITAKPDGADEPEPGDGVGEP